LLDHHLLVFFDTFLLALLLKPTSGISYIMKSTFGNIEIDFRKKQEKNAISFNENDEIV